jgi:hypothetical protein
MRKLEAEIYVGVQKLVDEKLLHPDNWWWMFRLKRRAYIYTSQHQVCCWLQQNSCKTASLNLSHFIPPKALGMASIRYIQRDHYIECRVWQSNKATQSGSGFYRIFIQLS